MQSSPPRFPCHNQDLYRYSSRVAYAVACPQENLDVPDLTYAASSPECSSTSSVSSSRTPDTLHIPLPTEPASTTSESIPKSRNAFIIFRCDYSPKITAWIEAITAKPINQNIVSVITGRIWKFLSEDEKQPYLEKADEEKLQHRMQYPGYRYQPPSNKRIKRVDSTPLKRVHSQKPYSRLPKKAPDASNDAMPLERHIPIFVPTKEPRSLDYMSTDQMRARHVQTRYFTVDTPTLSTLAPVEFPFGYRPDSTWLPSPPIYDLQPPPSTVYPNQSTSFDALGNQEALNGVKATGFVSLSSFVKESRITIPDFQTSTRESENMEYEQVIDGFLRSTSNTYQNADEGLEQLLNQYQ